MASHCQFTFQPPNVCQICTHYLLQMKCLEICFQFSKFPLYNSNVVCRYGSRVELSGKLTGKYDKFKVSPDHDRVQRCKGSNREHIFLASNVYFLQFSEIMYFDCRTLTVTRRTISPTSRGQHAAIFDICDTWVILSKKKKVPPKKDANMLQYL